MIHVFSTELDTFACGSKAALYQEWRQMRRGSGPKVNTSSGESEIMIYRPPMEVFAQKVETLEIENPDKTGNKFPQKVKK